LSNTNVSRVAYFDHGHRACRVVEVASYG